jgi:hypothetical protein
LWPPVKIGFDLVHRAAGILKNQDALSGSAVADRYQALIHDAASQAADAGKLKPAIEHLVKVTESYRPGLFHCYDVACLPRTNNVLEQLFGSTRHHERRCTGRKVASPSLVLRGSVRVVAGLGTRARTYRGDELAPGQIESWRTVRIQLERRRQTRVLRRRFRRNPVAYLQELEEVLVKPALPT